jgi:hypothetical protein
MNQNSGGIFDRKSIPSMRPENKPQTSVPLPKQDFKSPIQAAAEMTAKARMAAKAALNSKDATDEAKQQEAINAINNAAGDSSVKENEEALEELNKITEEDLKMAEAMIFNGYAEMTVPIPNFNNHKITVCTTSPEDMDIIDEMIFDLIKQNENKADNTVNLSDAIVKSTRNIYNLSLSYKGMDGNDVHTDKTCQLNIIKKGIESLYNYEAAGDLKGMGEMKEAVKSSIRKRSYMIKRMPTPMIDFISQTKYDFDKKMFDIMSMKNLVAK